MPHFFLHSREKDFVKNEKVRVAWIESFSIVFFRQVPVCVSHNFFLLIDYGLLYSKFKNKNDFKFDNNFKQQSKLFTYPEIFN